MVSEAAVLVVENHEQRRFPQRIVRPERVINLGD
jgi:hypothetical protein